MSEFFLTKKSRRALNLVLIAVFSLSFSMSCDYGMLGGADITTTYMVTEPESKERLNFFNGVWYSSSAANGHGLDSYRIRKWGDLTQADKDKAKALFPNMNIDAPKTYATNDSPKDDDFVLLYDDTVYGQSAGGGWGFCYMGLVRAVNVFNNDPKRGAIIIEYFNGADPTWLSDPDGYNYQGLKPGEKPFFGIYYKVIDENAIQFANAVDLAALSAGQLYYTEQGTLLEACNMFDVRNEAEFINWGVVVPYQREKE